MKKIKIELNYNLDTVLECGLGVYEAHSGITIGGPLPMPLCIIRGGTFSSKKGMGDIAEECRDAKTERELWEIASKLELTDDRIIIVFDEHEDIRKGNDNGVYE